MSKEIIEVLDHICGKLGVAIDWTSQNIMPEVTDVLHRYTQYNITTSAIWVLLCVSILTLTVYVLYRLLIKGCVKAIKNNKSTLCFNHSRFSIDMNGFGISVLTVGVFVVVFGLIALFVNASNLLSWIYVPEIEIFKMLQGMV